MVEWFIPMCKKGSVRETKKRRCSAILEHEAWCHIRSIQFTWLETVHNCHQMNCKYRLLLKCAKFKFIHILPHSIMSHFFTFRLWLMYAFAAVFILLHVCSISGLWENYNEYVIYEPYVENILAMSFHTFFLPLVEIKSHTTHYSILTISFGSRNPMTCKLI